MPIQSSNQALSPVLVLNAHFLPSSYDWRGGSTPGRDPYSVGTYLRQARTAAEVGFDILFQADFSGVARGRVRAGPWSPPFEAFQLAAVTAAAVDGIVVMPTLSTLHTHPITAARNLASLDRISGGRAAVNLVSSFRSGTALGAKRTVDRSRRHAQTEEYLAVLRALWASWPPAALEPDLPGDRWVRDDLIRDLNHAGEFYEQAGPIDVPPRSADFPQLMMPAGSLAGLRLAVRSGADYVFGAAPTLAAAKRLRRALREEAIAAGRTPDSVRLILGASLHISNAAPVPATATPPDETLIEVKRSLAQDIPSLGIDELALEDRLPTIFPDNAEESLMTFGARASGLWELAARPSQTLRDFLVLATRQGEQASFCGSAEAIGAEMRQWIDEGGLDGFQFIRGNDFVALCDTIVPSVRAARSPNTDR